MSDLFFEEDLAFHRAMADAAELASAKWRTKWPGHCRACSGWGGVAFAATYHQPADYEPCEALGPEFCHRCGYEGFDDDHKGLKTLDYDYSTRRSQFGCWWCEHTDHDGDPLS